MTLWVVSPWLGESAALLRPPELIEVLTAARPLAEALLDPSNEDRRPLREHGPGAPLWIGHAGALIRYGLTAAQRLSESGEPERARELGAWFVTAQYLAPARKEQLTEPWLEWWDDGEDRGWGITEPARSLQRRHRWLLTERGYRFPEGLTVREEPEPLMDEPHRPRQRPRVQDPEGEGACVCDMITDEEREAAWAENKRQPRTSGRQPRPLAVVRTAVGDWWHCADCGGPVLSWLVPFLNGLQRRGGAEHLTLGGAGDGARWRFADLVRFDPGRKRQVLTLDAKELILRYRPTSEVVIEQPPEPEPEPEEDSGGLFADLVEESPEEIETPPEPVRTLIWRPRADVLTSPAGDPEAAVGS